jgi:hypothetical protein
MENNYILLHPTQPNSGLFAFIWQTIRGIYHNPNKQYYFYFGTECCYYDDSLPAVNNNVWDYYFDQPHSPTFPLNIEKEVGILNDFESEFREGLEDFGLDFTEYNKRRFIFNKIINKYYKLNSHMDAKVQDFYNNYFVNKKILGIHCRGTDHPNNTDISKYIAEIDSISSEYDYIFVASDEQSKIDVLRQHFGEKLLTYNTFRSPNGLPIHISLRHMHNSRLIGEEALIEAYLLAKTNLLLIYTGSNVNFYVRALNPTLKYMQLKG